MTQRPEHLHYDASRRFPAGLPASGAWRHGDPVGNRAFAEICGERPFVLEGGGVLPEVTIAYETWGSSSSEPQVSKAMVTSGSTPPPSSTNGRSPQTSTNSRLPTGSP